MITCMRVKQLLIIILTFRIITRLTKSGVHLICDRIELSLCSFPYGCGGVLVWNAQFHSVVHDWYSLYVQCASVSQLNLVASLLTQALLPHKEGEPAGWWIGMVSKSKGEVAGVQFLAGEEHYTDLVEHKNLRVPNSK